MRLAALLLLAVGCSPEADVAPQPDLRGAAPEVVSSAPVLKRLTAPQYTNTLHDLLGAEVLVPDDLEPDAAANGLLQLGAGVNALSGYGVEHYETAAFDVAEHALAIPAVRTRVVPCTPVATRDDTCARAVLEPLGHRAWRRPLTSAEVDRVVGVAGVAATTLGDFDTGLTYGIAALLESPNFLYRIELGEEDPDTPGLRRYTGSEMATRLAYVLWNTMPDDALLAAAEAGDLTTDTGLATQVDRLLQDDRAREGVRAFFGDMLALYALDDLNKDPTVYVHMSADLGPSAREETLQGLDWLVFDEDGDYRDLFTTRTAFLDRKLAAIYGVPAPAMDGFARTELPDDGRRRGLLGQVSFLALQSHPANTSVTRRGLFVREVLLCQPLPSPPAGLNTSIPPATETAPTMRDRVAQHLQDPTCASCHISMDPIGLGLENFDGLGGWRDAENGVTIDASGDLDGTPFSDAWGLAQAVHDHPDTGPCFAKTLFQYANGHVLDIGEVELLDWHARGFEEAGWSVRALLRDIVTSPGFRRAGVVE
jgi:hypothetical protein